MDNQECKLCVGIQQQKMIAQDVDVVQFEHQMQYCKKNWFSKLNYALKSGYGFKKAKNVENLLVNNLNGILSFMSGDLFWNDAPGHGAGWLISIFFTINNAAHRAFNI